MTLLAPHSFPPHGTMADPPARRLGREEGAALQPASATRLLPKEKLSDRPRALPDDRP